MTAPHPEAARGARLAAFLVATICAYAVTVSLFWIGFLGSDDTLYWAGAGGWLAHFPYLGDTHWALRHTLVIPMAITRAVLGNGLPAMLLPSLLYTAGALIVTALWINRAAGLTTAVVAVALIITCPQFTLLSSIANVDIVECCFILAGFALLHAAMDPDQRPSRRASLLLLAGAATGLAMLSRETSVFAVAAIGLLFLAGYGMHRAWYFVIGAGFAAIVGSELLYVWWMSGNLFYRATISLHHDQTIDRWVDQGLGVPVLHPAIDPITMFLFNHNFGLLTWIGVPLAVWLMRRANPAPSSRRIAVVALTLAATWTFIAAAWWSQLNLVPRYFLVPAVMLSLVSGIALPMLWRGGRPRLAFVLGSLLLTANVFAMWIDNRNYMFGEDVLVEIAAREPGPIHTDHETRRRAQTLLEWAGTFDRVTEAPAGPGDLRYLNPARDPTPPGADWKVIERHGLSPSVGQWLARHLLPDRMLSPSLFAKLGRGHPDVTLYRLP